MKIKFNKVFYLGLLAFIRKVELSIDRRQSQNELINYFDSGSLPSLNTVIERLLSFDDDLEITNNQEMVKGIDKNFIERYFDKVFFKYSLKKTELEHLLYLLISLQDVVKFKNHEDEFLNKIRFSFRQFYEEIFQNRVEREDYERILQVEHLNQNKSIRTDSIENLVGGDWLLAGTTSAER